MNKKNNVKPKKKRRLIKKVGIGLLVVLLSFIFSVGLACAILMWPSGDGNPNTKVWFSYMKYGDESADYHTDNGVAMDYSYDYIFEIEKNPDKDFVVLNLTDIQKFGFEWVFTWTDATLETIDHMIATVKPDLITLSGDNVWGPDAEYSNKQLIKIMDSYGIPWAPVFGNHDGEVKTQSFNYLADMFINKSKHCIFAKGPGNIGGVGNYVINVTENGKIVHTFMMMDSHSSNVTYLGKNGENKGGYEYLSESQINWYKWVIGGITEKEGHVVESTLIMHIPLPQYRIAYDLYLEGSDEVVYHSGDNREYGGHPSIDSGMFDAILEMGSTHRVIAGHDHVNDSYITYKGVDLIYGVKTGDGCYWVEDGSINGGTILTIGDSISVEQSYFKAKGGTTTVSKLIGAHV